MLETLFMSATFIDEIIERLRLDFKKYRIGVYLEEKRDGRTNRPIGYYKRVRFYIPYTDPPFITSGRFFSCTGGEYVAKKLGQFFGIEYHYSPDDRPAEDPDILIPASDVYFKDCYMAEELEPVAQRMIELKILLDRLEEIKKQR